MLFYASIKKHMVWEPLFAKKNVVVIQFILNICQVLGTPWRERNCCFVAYKTFLSFKYCFPPQKVKTTSILERDCSNYKGTKKPEFNYINYNIIKFFSTNIAYFNLYWLTQQKTGNDYSISIALWYKYC